MEQAHLDIQDLEMSFGDVPVLTGLSLKVAKGQTVALRGESGCGKTTALRCIAGLEHPTGGIITCNTILLNGQDTFIPPESRNVGLVFQGNALFPHMTVAQNIAFGIYRVPKARQQGMINDMLGTMELDGLGKRYPHELSGGQQQRVAVGRSLITEPDLLLMDEPFSDLDVRTKSELRESIKRILLAKGITTIIVSHHDDDLESMADETYTIANGRIVS